VSNIFDAQERTNLSLEDVLAVESLQPVVVDWRIRPLTEELLMIAARSVWYLPQLTELRIQRASEAEILSSCQEFSVPANSKFVIDDDEYLAVMAEIMHPLIGIDEIEGHILLDLVKWRDSVAAIEDESPNFVASNLCLRKIVEAKPRTVEELNSLLGELSSPYVDSFRADLLYIVKKYVEPEPALADRLQAGLG
jgi:ribonuclease D